MAAVKRILTCLAAALLLAALLSCAPAEPNSFDYAGLYRATDDAGVFVIDALTLEDGFYGSTDFYGSTAYNGRYAALVSGGPHGDHSVFTSKLTLFDLAKNKVCWQLELGNGVHKTGFLPDGRLFTGCSSTGSVTVYTAKGEKQYEYTGVGEGYAAYCDESGRLWCFDGGDLHRLNGGEDKIYELGISAQYPTVLGVTGEVVYYSISGSLRRTLSYNTANGETADCLLLTGFKCGGSLMTRLAENRFYYAADGSAVNSVPWVTDGIGGSSACEGNYAFLTDGDSVARLDTASGLLARHTFSGLTVSAVAPFGGAAVITATGADGQYVCYLSADGEAQQTLEISLRELGKTELDNIALAAELSNRHGLHISGTALGMDTTVGSGHYTFRADTEVGDVTDFLRALEQCLSEYPDSFFTSLRRGGFPQIAISYGSDLFGSSYSSINVAGAITSYNASSISLIFNISAFVRDDGATLFRLRQTLSHELMHVIQNLLDYENPDLNPLEGYDVLNPEGFEYADRYVDLDTTDAGNGSYTPESYKSYDDIWFADRYSKTFAAEDSAVIFSNMNSMHKKFLFNSPHIVAKAEYISNLLREHFPEWYADGEPNWEQFRTMTSQ